MSAQSVITQYNNMKSAPGSGRPARSRTPSTKGLESIAMKASPGSKRKKDTSGRESGTDATARKQSKRRPVAVVPRATALPSPRDDDAVQTLLEIRDPGRRRAGDSSSKRDREESPRPAGDRGEGRRADRVRSPSPTRRRRSGGR